VKGVQRRIVSLIDVDNTLLDNDRVKTEMDRRLAELLGAERAASFWAVYEQVRAEETVVDIPNALARFTAQRGVGRALRFELADLFLSFPFDQFLFPGALETLAYLRELGPTAILSDGDPVYQTAKIARSGLAQAAGGYALVFRHKEDHVAEITAAFPADHYLSIDDKPHVLQRLGKRMVEPLSTIFVRQGHYAHGIPPGQWPGAGLTVEEIAAVRQVEPEELVAAGRGVQID
jgi:hypothetical protein